MANNIESTVCFFKELYKTLASIPDADAGILMRALFADANGEIPDFKGSTLAEALFTMAADQMHRLEQFRRKKANRSKTEQNGAKESKTEQNGAPYPFPSPSPVYRERPKKIQNSFGFSTERKNVDYNEIEKQLREASEWGAI